MIHLVEPGGRGGVFQHTVALADALVASGAAVRLHSASDPELTPDPPVDYCGCVDWHRHARRFRRVRIATSYVGRTLSHLTRDVREGDVAHFEGLFKPPLTLLTLLVLKLRARRLVHSPHNTFVRSGHMLERALIRAAEPLVDEVIVFSAADERVVRRRGRRRVSVSPLVVLVPPVHADLVSRWRDVWATQANTTVILFAGQLRPDKRLDLLLHAAQVWPEDWKLAVVGEDVGAGDGWHRLARRLDVDVEWSTGYHDLAAFAAAIAAADVVACPYERASQSAVAALAAALGTPTVVADVGGLGEYGTASFDLAHPEQIPEAVREALAQPTTASSPRERMIDVHFRAYQWP